MTKKIGTIKIGDTITYRGAWGTEPPKQAVVEGIEKTEEPHSKYGESVDEISTSELDYALFDLSDGHWCYGYQVAV